MHPGYVLPAVEQFRLGRWIVLQIVCLSEVIYRSLNSMLVLGVELFAFPPLHRRSNRIFTSPPSPVPSPDCCSPSFVFFSNCLFLRPPPLLLLAFCLPHRLLIFVFLHFSSASLADNKIATDRDGKYLPVEKIVQKSSQKTQAMSESKKRKKERKNEWEPRSN